MKRPTGAELRSSPSGERNAGCMHYKLTKPKIFLDREQARNQKARVPLTLPSRTPKNVTLA